MSTDFRAAGRAAYETGEPAAPTLDPDVRAALAELPVGACGAAEIMAAWSAGWHAALAQSTPGMVTGNYYTLYRARDGRYCVVVYAGPEDGHLYPVRGPYHDPMAPAVRVGYVQADGDEDPTDPGACGYDWADPWALTPIRELTEDTEDTEDTEEQA